MSAVHQCPGCRKPFSYLPSDYHTRVACGNEGCSRTFGFLQHAVSARRWAEVRKELGAAQEERLSRAEAKARRAARGAARAPIPAAAAASSSTSSSSSSSSAPAPSDTLFLLELTDECPRCGQALEEGQTPAEHLAACTDARAHAAHAAARAAQARKAAEGAGKQAAGEAALALAGWEAGGRVVGGLWRLPLAALQQLCSSRGLGVGSGSSSRVQLVRALAGFFRSGLGSERLALEDAGVRGGGGSSSSSSSSSSAGAGAGARRGGGRVDTAAMSQLDAHELPSNLHALSAESLACVCAAFGLAGEESEGKGALIRRLEREMHRGREQEVGLLLGDGEAGGRREMLADAEEEDDEEEEAEEEEDDDDEEGSKKKRQKRK
jgi:hypothetical protein